ncbi:Predicted arabinose efflux permease, MFS family [Lentzea fradiae]|uniref:Predicted arabinose efflux permease, MFS family n=1 Tax=Lentzea fradiae TaxID=200378 RepID=A0A1G8DA99_9PSEU|nr:MFS transporter [Lentzea fradiae]SDH54484.1 Predicted arabinose efflux permease, MFS family [Lentzea fradiae]
MTTLAAQTHHWGSRRFLGIPEYRRLLATRLASQWGDGLFQAGLAGAVLFNPERHAAPAAIAAGFAVLLLPYSLVGPFAGALLDRWDRKKVIVVANLLRGVFVLGTAAAVGAGLSGLPLYVFALVVMGIGRFVGSGLSASLPHVVPEDHLVEANALATTAGAITAVVGAGCAIGLRALLGAGDGGSGWTTSFAVLGLFLGAFIAGRFKAGVLGPDAVDEPDNAVKAVARGLLDGAKATARTPSVTAGLAALLAHRAGFAVSLMITLLLMRYSLEDFGFLKAGIAGLGEIAVAGGAGILLAGVLTDRLVDRFGTKRTICGALLLTAAAQVGLGLPMTLPTVLAAGFFVIFAGQVIKLCVDTAVQHDVGDEVRGRVFSLYDTLFNVTQVTAVSITATMVPLDGRSPGLLLTAAGLYLAGLAAYLVASARKRQVQHPGLVGEDDRGHPVG